MSNYAIPTSVNIGDKTVAIRDKGDYRMVLDCFNALGDVELSQRERIFSALIIFYEDLNGIEDVLSCGDTIEERVKCMYSFFNCNNDKIGTKTPYKILDWEEDAQLISAAVNKVAGKEIRAEDYVHWWTFLGYYSSIGECPLTTILTIRNKIVKQKKLDKAEREFRNDNPEYFQWNRNTVEQQEAEEWLSNIWNRKEEGNATI